MASARSTPSSSLTPTPCVSLARPALSSVLSATHTADEKLLWDAGRYPRTRRPARFVRATEDFVSPDAALAGLTMPLPDFRTGWTLRGAIQPSIPIYCTQDTFKEVSKVRLRTALLLKLGAI